ncbi:hypothetical protein FP568_09220 [Pandoraea pnomenusa]|uniref:hypothetical protein n=1 Tax=Pandoraea pnomenusa TaxID=93220 RepID=UPI0011988224|nr:hypothetical protein [Pandoraea pnomenusa]QDX21414.1 hypothetical protein FP568_09220 [Pandoraea pnomenusa]
MTQTFEQWAESEGLDMSVDWKGEFTSPVTAGALRGWEAAQSAGQKAVRYFVYDNEYGYNEFKTDAERDAAHRSAIEGYLDDGWSEEVESVVSGIVTHKTVECNVEHAPPRCEAHPEQDGDDCSECAAWNEWPNHEYDYTCSYKPEALAGAPMNGFGASEGAGSGTRTDTPASSPSDDTASQGAGTAIVAAHALASPANVAKGDA